MQVFNKKLEEYNLVKEKVIEFSNENKEKLLNEIITMFFDLSIEDQEKIFAVYGNINRITNIVINHDVSDILKHLKELEEREIDFEERVENEINNIEKFNSSELIKLKVWLVKTITVFFITIIFIGIIASVISNNNFFNPIYGSIFEFFKIVGILFKR